MDLPANHRNSQVLVCNDVTAESIRLHAKLLTKFLKENKKVMDSYILDYFVEKLWMCFPDSWFDFLLQFQSQDLENFINSDKEIRYKSPMPLSLLAFRASAFSLSLPRKPVSSLRNIKNFFMENYPSDCSLKNIDWDNLDSAYDSKSGQHKSIPEFCRRHVKPKKQHEIFCMGQLAAAVLTTLQMKHAIDIGSGQGHLSRYLALCYKLNVSTIEAEKSHVLSATNFDKKAYISMKTVRQHVYGTKKLKPTIAEIGVLPHHLEGSVTTETSKIFLNKVFRKPDDDVEHEFKETFALLGLHTCGNLAPTILKLFCECEDAKAVISVGCCYMKLTSDSIDQGYPLSSYVKSLPNHHLSYEAKEMACHALEMYRKRLKDNAPSLKIHCYRATLEKCIVAHYPDKKHMGLRGVRNAENLPFSVYAEKALSKVSCHVPEKFYLSPDIQACLGKWKEVLIFYSLRLLIAPVVESLILLDRLLFLYEHGHPSCVVPLFDPEISPRNQVIVTVCKDLNHT